MIIALFISFNVFHYSEYYKTVDLLLLYYNIGLCFA